MNKNKLNRNWQKEKALLEISGRTGGKCFKAGKYSSAIFEICLIHGRFVNHYS